jgi:hypothetical protein
VLILVVQKLIKKNEVKPINSHPRKTIIVFPDDTKNNMLKIKEQRNNKKRSTSGSYLK